MAHISSGFIQQTRILLHIIFPAGILKTLQNGGELKIDTFASFQMQQNLTENQFNETDVMSDVRNCMQNLDLRKSCWLFRKIKLKVFLFLQNYRVRTRKFPC